ncbi:d-ribose pyranase rbsd/l-fucose mutarotase fucu [Lucifera butyrica]|uniref:D-ribose pyranase rbsd/l-fucose mutarotase fucu n=1 Tax=Lucifera butyrica TaxID=1351585 RepID=A0A498RHW6_9FIRM|nr:RbsD/FucU domain-containing protein [Lucifera butyrica]VBB09682.1 d-ribose pyranase rbsd/l-fucose mutarotase fucu [Lucifera butyrica]
MLKGIPDIISPELLKILHEMGHGDDLVIGDANYPAASNAQRLVRCDGHGVPVILDAILQLFPLDCYVEIPVALMQVVPGDPTVPEIQAEIRSVVSKYEERGDTAIEYLERFDFYERAKQAYAIVATTEKKLYGCMLIKKGVIK